MGMGQNIPYSMYTQHKMKILMLKCPAGNVPFCALHEWSI